MAKRRTTRKPEQAVAVSRDRINSYLRGLYNPLVSLTPESLKAQQAAFESGHLRQFAITQQQMVMKDDLLPGVVGKRVKAPSVRGYEILMVDDSPEAQRHKVVLEYFYNNLTATNAVDENERGGVSLMLRQMMGAVGFKYSNHEIVWQPSANGISAEVRWVPLSFFENTSGRLRFLPSEGTIYGQDLEPGRWMVTVGEHLMMSCAIAYLFKRYPLRDWLIYCGRHGMPGIAGETSASPGTPEWKAMETAVASIAAEFTAVHTSGDKISKIDLTSNGELPYPKLIERMDRMMSALWRGADLSTMSSGSGSEGSGASLQAEEQQILEASDAAMLSEACNEYLDAPAIQYYLGDEEPLAYFQVKTATRKNIDQELKIDDQLNRLGFPITLKSLSERYNRPLPDKDEERLPPPPQAPGSPVVAAANVRMGQDTDAVGAIMAEARMSLAGAVAADLRPIGDRLARLLEFMDSGASEADVQAELQKFLREELPALATQILREPASVEAFVDAMSAALANGIETAAEATS
jgi:phage gp29-like protein